MIFKGGINLQTTAGFSNVSNFWKKGGRKLQGVRLKKTSKNRDLEWFAAVGIEDHIRNKCGKLNGGGGGNTSLRGSAKNKSCT